MITQEAFDRLMREQGAFLGGYDFSLETATEETVTLRLRFDRKYLRPGGTVSGPTMFALADVTMWMLAIGATDRGLMTLTTDMTMHFMRATRDRDLLAHGRTLRMGRRLAVFSVSIVPEGEEEPVCHATGTYSIPSSAPATAVAAS